MEGGVGRSFAKLWLCEIFIYDFLKIFAEKVMSFILTFVQMSNFVKYQVW